MKRILYIESAPQAGGSTVSLFELVRRIDRRSFEPLLLLCPSNPYRQRFADSGVRVLTSPAYCSVRTPSYPPALTKVRSGSLATRLRGNSLTRAGWRAAGLAARTILHTLPMAPAVKRLVGDESIALVHLNDAPELHKSGILASRWAGVPCICHVRSMPPLDSVDRFLARFVSQFIFISEAVEQDQRQRGIGRLPGVVIHNALDLTAFQTPDRQTARSRFGLAATDKVVGMMGRIEPWKGHRDLLAALATLAPRFPGLRCLIAGTPELDGAWYLDELTATVASLGLEHIVSFIGYQDAPQFLAALDVLAHASVQPEPFGRVLIEGMAAGLPVVATNAGGVPEIVLDGQTGLLVPPGDAPALASAIGRLLADADQARAMGGHGCERASLFAIENHVAAIESIYRGILKL